MQNFKKISVALSLFALAFLALSSVSFATISLSIGNNSVAPVNQVLLNFTWTNSTPVTNTGPTWNATANITFILPAGISYINGTTNFTIATTNMTGGMNFSIPNSTATTVIFGNGSVGTPISNDTIDTSGWLAFNISANASGTFVITVNETYLVNNGTSQYNVSTNITLGIVNGTITLTNATFSNVTYSGTGVQMNFTGTVSAAAGGGAISDNIVYTLNMNTTLAATNTTNSGGGSSNGIGTINYTNATAGLYTFTFSTTGTTNYSAVSLTAVLNISKAIPVLNLFANGLPSNQTIVYPATPTVSANASLGNNTIVPEPTFNIYIVNITDPASTSTILTSSGNAASIAQILGNGTYQIVYNTTGSSNFTSASNSSLNLTVNKGILNGTVSGSNVTYPTSVSINSNQSANSISTDVNFTFWRNNTLISSATNANPPTADTTQLAAGTYQYILNSSGGANWTSNATIKSYLIIVSTGILNGTITGSNVTYPTSVAIYSNQSANGIGTDLNFTFWRNTTLLYSGFNSTAADTTKLAAGTYIYVFNSSGGSNWTSNSSILTYTVVVAQATPALTLSLSSSSVSQSTTTTATGTGCPSDGAADVICTLYRSGSSVDNPESARLGTGAYTYTYSTSGGINWTSASKSSTLTVTVGGGTSGGASSGGGGGAIVTQTPTTQTVVTPSKPQVTITINKVAASIDEIKPGTPATVTIAKSDTGVTAMDVSVKNAVTSVGIDINKVDKLPADVKTPQGKVYKQLNIIKSNVADADVDKITIKFAVEKSWLAANKIDQNKVKLQRYTGGQWTSLTATKLSEDSEFVYYSAETPGLSYFVVSGEEVAPTTTTTTSPAVSAPQASDPLYYAIAGIAILAVAVVIYKVMKKGKRSRRK